MTPPPSTPVVQLVILGNPATGAVQVQGPIGDLRLIHWLLGEARRVCEREANRRDAKADNGTSGLVIAQIVPTLG